MTRNFNTAPYFDDYFEEQADGTLQAKPFYKVLFKPGFAAQARELNQMQSILGHQVSSMGNHLFKKNTVIIPGGISYNTTADIISLEDGTVETAASLVGKTITNAASFDPTDFEDLKDYIVALVIASREATDDEPAALYIQYKNSQADRATFIDGEALKTVDSQLVEFQVHDTIGATVGKVASVAKGVFYTKELFVDALDQTVIVEVDNTVVTNCIVGLNIEEEIVTAADDNTLLDNANGSPNEYAPGADRYKIVLTLARFDINTTGITDDNFIRLISIENDTVTYLNDSTQYAYLMDTLAHRTFDANGNFVVRGLATSISTSDDDDFVFANVSKGKCYLGGYEYNQIANHKVALEKPRSADYQVPAPRKSESPSPLTYFYVAGDATTHTLPGNLIQFVPVSLQSGTLNIATDVIGSAIYRNIEYVRGHASSNNDIYRVIVDNVSMEAGWTLKDIGGIRFVCTPAGGYFQGTSVLHELTLGNVIGEFEIGDAIESNFSPTSKTYDATGNISEYTVTCTIPSTDRRLLRPGWKVAGTNIGPDAHIRKVTSTGLILTDYNTGAVASAITVTNPQSGTVYYVVLNKLYVRKDTPAPVPYDSTIKCAAVTASLLSSFVTNYTPAVTPFIKIDNVPLLGLNDVEYFIVRSDSFAVPSDPGASNYPLTLSLSGDGSGSPLFGQDRFSGDKGRHMWAYIPAADTYVEIKNSSGINVDLTPNEDDDQDYDIELDEDWAFWNTDLVIYATVKKVGAYGASKSKEVATIAIPNPSDSWMSLSNQDVVSVDKIVEGKNVIVTGASWLAGTATVVTSYTRAQTAPQYNHAAGDVVVVKGIVSTGGTNPATTGEYYKAEEPGFPLGFNGFAGYNGKQTLLTALAVEGAPSGGLVTVTLTVTYSVAVNPGTYGSVGTVALEPDIDQDTEITTRYRWDSGNTAYTIGTGNIKKLKNAVRPSGQLGVQYTYYTMGLDDGDFVSVDSYIEGSDNSYIGEIPDIIDPVGNVIKARSSFDYRTRLSRICFKNIASIEEGSNILKLKDINLSAWAEDLIESYIVGPSHGQVDETDSPAEITYVSYNETTGDTELWLTLGGVTEFPASRTVTAGTYFVGLKLFTTVTPHQYQLSLVDEDFDGRMFTYPKTGTGTRLRYTYTKFLPRNLMLFVNRDDQNLLTLDSIDVNNVNVLKQYVRDSRKLPLAFVHMEPYTLSVKDVTVTKFAMPVYQMVDIDQIKQKVDGLEYNVSLALNRDLDSAVSKAGDTEDNAANFGFWNEDFMNYTTHDYESGDFACTVYDSAYVAPGTLTRSIGLDLANVNPDQYKKSGSVITLPYTEVRAFGNDAASSYSNLNPFNRIQWEGKMRLYPSVDNWIDVTGNPPPVGGGDSGVQVPFPPLPTDPPYTIPPDAKPETVSDINLIAVSWGPDSNGGKHSITFEWKTSTGRTGRVNTDIHLSPAIKKHGASGYDGTFAKSLINRKYNNVGVKEYLQAGQHFDQKAPEDWK